MTLRLASKFMLVLGVLLPLAAQAEPARRSPVVAADVLPPYEIVTTVRSMGLTPVGKPVRRGYEYVLHAIDPEGVEVRVVADAQFGEVLSVMPAGAPADLYAPRYSAGPRIIQIPQAGDRAAVRPPVKRSAIAPADLDDDAEELDELEAAPVPAPKRIKPAPLPPPVAPPRAMLTPPPRDNPAWIKPTPRYSNGKFAPDLPGTAAAPRRVGPEAPVAEAPPPAPPPPNQLIQFPPAAPLN